MENKLISTLTDIGLTEKEAAVYMAAVSLGPSNITKIGGASGVKRTTVYPIIESLKQKGLIRVDVKGWKTLFVAENPEKLETILEQKRAEVRKVLPDFLSLYNKHSSGAFIRYYEGLEAVKGVYEELLKDVRPNEDYLIVGDLRQWLDQDPKFFQSFVERRAKLPIKIRLLLQDSPIAREYQKFQRNYNEEIRLLPADFKFTANIVIIPRRLVINQNKLPIIAMVIENESIIEMQREMFEIIWRSVG